VIHAARAAAEESYAIIAYQVGVSTGLPQALETRIQTTSPTMTDTADTNANGAACDPQDEASIITPSAETGTQSHALVRRELNEAVTAAPFTAEVQDAPSFEDAVAAAPPLPVIGRRRRRRKRVEANAMAREGRRRILWATTYVYAVATALHAAGSMKDEGLRALGALLKRGAQRRRLSAVNDRLIVPSSDRLKLPTPVRPQPSA
jgi:hypothetical protein